MTCAQGLLRLPWGGARSWSATGLVYILPQKLGKQEDFESKLEIFR